MVAVKPLITFTIGAVIGAIMTTHISFHSISIPIAILTFVLLDINVLILRERAEDADLGTLLPQSTDMSSRILESSASYQTT